jgi:hypothetical protein
MDRKPDLPALLLFAALLFGIIVRFYPSLASGFPLNDGGMFYVMMRDLKANGFALPDFTTYNNAGIPFAYPPLGIYAAALLSALTPGSDLWVFLFIPAFVSSLGIPAFYLFAREITSSRTLAPLAALIYALNPGSFQWPVMGGGVTRSFGLLFMFLMFWQAIKLFKEYHPRHLLLTILFGVATVTSHPQTAFHAVMGGLVLFLFFGRNKRGFLSAVLVGLGVALLAAPWWLTVLLRHGLDTFLSAGGTSPRMFELSQIILDLNPLTNLPSLPFLVFFYIGLVASLRERNFLYIVWILSALISDPRGGGGIALLSESILAAIGITQVSAWMNFQKTESVSSPWVRRGGVVIGLIVFLWFMAAAIIGDFRLVNTSVKTEDLELIQWVNENTSADTTFALATGREFSMTDPLQEWFPALTGRTSLTTLQGKEWTLSEEFFPWLLQLAAFQKCPDMTCVNDWSFRHDAAYDYLIVLIPPETARDALFESLRSLGSSARASAALILVYESEDALVFEDKK